jgi:hypothetical protein
MKVNIERIVLMEITPCAWGYLKARPRSYWNCYEITVAVKPQQTIVVLGRNQGPTKIHQCKLTIPLSRMGYAK